MLTLGQQIAQRRQSLGMTQLALAQAAGIPQPNLSNIEKDKQDLTVSSLRRIAHALKTPIQELFEEKKLNPLSWNRTRLEKLAAAAVGNKESLNSEEKQIVEWLKAQLPGSRQGIRKTERAWVQLKSRLTDAKIRALFERIRDHQMRTKRIGREATAN